MKYFLILYMFSMSETGSKLIDQKTLPIEYPNYYDCLSDGYIRAYSTIMTLGPQKVMEQKLLITFNCKENNGISS
jgi:hypothetical protein